MEDNIFKNITFGDKFLTKSARVLIFHCNRYDETLGEYMQFIEEYNSSLLE